jgi:hypothetical protein
LFTDDLGLLVPALRRDPGICLRCRSAALLCGKPVCPILVKFDAFTKRREGIIQRIIPGSTPPGIFVGRYGWPKVRIGPLVTPEVGDTLLYDSPEMWVGRPLEEIVGFRTSLVRGTSRFHVEDANHPTRLLEDLQLVSLSTSSSDVEATFQRAPRFHLTLSDEVPPYGPTAPLEKFDLNEVKVDQRMEKSTSDIHAPAKTAVFELYEKGLPVSRIERAFSAGTLGRKGHRRFVPTRWSITAVDDILSKANLERVKCLQEFSEWWLYRLTALGNRWFILLLPGSFRYESIEAWYPRTLWNPVGSDVMMIGDWEAHDGRTVYAGMGGCYYAGRLAVTEHLERIQHQAGVVILREILPGQIMPLGVWNVREHVRATFQQKPERLVSIEAVYEKIKEFLAIPLPRWLGQSHWLSEWKAQRRLDEFPQ